jgi:hypothetical protein
LPSESFSFSLAMDATDQVALPVDNLLAQSTISPGIYARLAALEMLMFPLDAAPGKSALLGTQTTNDDARAVPAGLLRTVLFMWGKLRILPVRVTSLTITEKLFDEFLTPTHADAQIELRVLTSTELGWVAGQPTSQLKDIAGAAYSYSQNKRVLLALLNLKAAALSIGLPNFAKP